MKTLAEIEKIKEENIALCPFGMDMIYRKAWDDLMPLMLEREKVAKDALDWYANPCGECEKQWIGTCHGSPTTAREALEKLA